MTRGATRWRRPLHRETKSTEPSARAFRTQFASGPYVRANVIRRPSWLRNAIIGARYRRPEVRPTCSMRPNVGRYQTIGPRIGFVTRRLNAATRRAKGMGTRQRYRLTAIPRRLRRVNVIDVLTHGHRDIERLLARMQPTDWEATALGTWSTKDLVGHLGAFEVRF